MRHKRPVNYANYASRHLLIRYYDGALNFYIYLCIINKEMLFYQRRRQTASETPATLFVFYTARIEIILFLLPIEMVMHGFIASRRVITREYWQRLCEFMDKNGLVDTGKSSAEHDTAGQVPVPQTECPGNTIKIRKKIIFNDIKHRKREMPEEIFLRFSRLKKSDNSDITL